MIDFLASASHALSGASVVTLAGGAAAGAWLTTRRQAQQERRNKCEETGAQVLRFADEVYAHGEEAYVANRRRQMSGDQDDYHVDRLQRALEDYNAALRGLRLEVSLVAMRMPILVGPAHELLEACQWRSASDGTDIPPDTLAYEVLRDRFAVRASVAAQGGRRWRVKRRMNRALRRRSWAVERLSPAE